MAKWGMGDPRWIVEERADAKNVNNWHWTEKDATPWSKDKMRNLFLEIRFDDPASGCVCRIAEVEKMEGEASASNRKSKLIFFYEWNIKLKWNANVPGAEKPDKGTVTIANLSEENDLHEIDIDISVSTSPSSERSRNVMKSVGVPLIRKAIGEYLKALKEEYSHDLILPRNDDGKLAASSTAPCPDSKSNTNNSGANNSAFQPRAAAAPKNTTGVRLDTKKLETSEEFMATASDVYLTLTDVQRVQAFTRGPATIEPRKGGKFSLLDGNITGQFVDLIVDEKIIMKWRLKSWPDAHYSEVTLDIVQDESSTRIKLKQTGIPTDSFEQTATGWKNYYWNSIRETFGFGSRLY